MRRDELLARSTSWREDVSATYLALLAPAADERDAIEQVHAFRVALRRLRSVLPALTSGIGKTKRRAIDVALRAIADATGETRDEEVLDETLAGLHLGAADDLLRWRAGRSRRLRGTRGRALEALRGELAPVLSDALCRLAETDARLPDDAASSERARAFLGARLRALIERAEYALAHGTSEDFHRARIGAKKLRYGCEWFAREEAPELAIVAERCAKIQKTLGRLHDIDEAIVRMDRARGLTLRADVLAELTKRRRRAEERACEDLRRLVPKVADALERAFAALAATPSARALEQGGDPLPDADAQGSDASLGSGPDHPVQQGRHDAGPGAADRMAERDGAA
jgi:CHAD domain-containing protein